MHLHYTKDEFWDSTHCEIYKMWKEHVRFNNWKLKSNDEEENKTETKKRVNIEELPFL